jgi:DNA-binding NtrC family response regulator
MLPEHMARQLMVNDWPGNVRQLRNVADRFVLGVLDPRQQAPLPGANVAHTLTDQLDVVEKALIEQALRQHGGRPLPVCQTLGIAKKTLYDLVHRHGFVIGQFRSRADADSEWAGDDSERLSASQR